MMALRLLVCVITVSLVTSYRPYQAKIPNGDKVPNPCKSGAIWSGVGHINPAGTGERNPFGIAFGRANKVWSNVCNQDTDGDGKTNGEELGDPDCVWTEGDTPARTTSITHPGICNDLNSDTCKTKNSWITGECGSSSAVTVYVSTVLVAFLPVVYLLL